MEIKPTEPEPTPQLDLRVVREKVRNAYNNIPAAPGTIQSGAVTSGEAHPSRVATEPASQSSTQADVPPAGEDWDRRSGLLDDAAPQGSPTVIGPVAPEHIHAPSPAIVKGVVTAPGTQQPATISRSPGSYAWNGSGNFFGQPPATPPPIAGSPGTVYQSAQAPEHFPKG